MSVPRQIMTGNRNNYLKTGKIIQDSMEFCPWPMRDVCQHFLQGVKEGFAVTSGRSMIPLTLVLVSSTNDCGHGGDDRGHGGDNK